MPREGHDYPSKSFDQVSRISIHVPREGHDVTAPIAPKPTAGFQSTCPARGTTTPICHCSRGVLISIHVPREGHDAILAEIIAPQPKFQSTCPARGTTPPQNLSAFVFCHFNPRAPRGARQGLLLLRQCPETFQSTCPARGTTIRF